jgi:hypothetical protein
MDNCDCFHTPVVFLLHDEGAFLVSVDLLTIWKDIRFVWTLYRLAAF